MLAINVSIPNNPNLTVARLEQFRTPQLRIQRERDRQREREREKERERATNRRRVE